MQRNECLMMSHFSTLYHDVWCLFESLKTPSKREEVKLWSASFVTLFIPHKCSQIILTFSKDRQIIYPYTVESAGQICFYLDHTAKLQNEHTFIHPPNTPPHTNARALVRGPKVYNLQPRIHSFGSESPYRRRNVT